MASKFTSFCSVIYPEALTMLQTPKPGDGFSSFGVGCAPGGAHRGEEGRVLVHGQVWRGQQLGRLVDIVDEDGDEDDTGEGQCR